MTIQCTAATSSDDYIESVSAMERNYASMVLTRDNGDKVRCIREINIRPKTEWTKLKVRREESLKVMRIWYHFAIGEIAYMQWYIRNSMCWCVSAHSVSRVQRKSRIANTIQFHDYRCVSMLDRIVRHRMFDMCSICVYYLPMTYGVWRVIHSLTRSRVGRRAPTIRCSTFFFCFVPFGILMQLCCTQHNRDRVCMKDASISYPFYWKRGSNGAANGVWRQR